MAAEKVPAFQFYPRDFLSDAKVMSMSMTERGIYITLLCSCWTERSLPLETDALAKLVGLPLVRFTKVWEKSVVKTCFQLNTEDGRLHHKRLDEEREKQAMWRERASLGGRARNSRMADAKAKATHTQAEWLEMREAYGRCLRCGEKGGRLEPDHIVPIYQGGHDGITNIQPLCPRCNCSKGPDSTDLRIGLPETLPKWVQSPIKHDVSSASHLLTHRRVKRADEEEDQKKEKKVSPILAPPLPVSDTADAVWLLDRYGELYREHRKGARLALLHGPLVYAKAADVCRTWPDRDRLEKLIKIFLVTDDDWISRTDRGFGVFAAKASWCDDRLAQWEADQQAAV